ncbi:MAG: hypothetical protein CBC65_002175 [Rhodothermaceae bacterium TMED105]|jgi:hypothetical protein|nr:MAG: hypothetical protein CBC65_002175 [Rhodothermaceae bacterium TMED105]|tara:strand:+ start:609 stop:1106 length:498 start_codon:yes stop_codon:yes gene_type:complete
MVEEDKGEIVLVPLHGIIILILVGIYFAITRKMDNKDPKTRKTKLKIIGASCILFCLSPFLIDVVDGDDEENPNEVEDAMATALFFGIISVAVMILAVVLNKKPKTEDPTLVPAPPSPDVNASSVRPSEGMARGIRPTFRGIDPDPVRQRNVDLMRNYKLSLERR